MQQTLTGTVEPIPNVVTATLNVDTSGIVGGIIYGGTQLFQITGDDTGATSSGNAPHSYSFNTGVSLTDNDYEFTSGPTIVPTQPSTGTITSDTTVNTVITGTIQKKQGEATLVITNNITGGDENIAYQISTNPGNLTITGAVGNLAEWTATVTALGGYQFTSGPSFNPGNPVSTILTETPQNVPLTITGTVQPISTCSDTTVVASAGAEIQVTLCDGSIVVLTEGVDDLSNLCIQTGEVVALTGTVEETEFNGACETPQRFVATFFNTNSSDLSPCDTGVIDTTSQTIMYLDNKDYVNIATEAWTTSTGPGRPPVGKYTDCGSIVFELDSNGQMNKIYTDPAANFTSLSAGLFETTSAEACENANVGRNYFVWSPPYGSNPESGIVADNKIIFSESFPFTNTPGVALAEPTAGNNFVKIKNFIIPDDFSYNYEIGVVGTPDQAKVLSSATCPEPSFVYLMQPCPESTQSQFFAKSTEELTIGGVYSVTLGPPGVTSATVLQTGSLSNPTAEIGNAVAGGCPPPTLAAIILTGDGSANGCGVPDSEPTLTPCQTWEFTGNAQGFVVDYTDCEGNGTAEEVLVGATVTRCASDTPTSVGSPNTGTITSTANTCPSEYGYPTRVAWVSANYDNFNTDDQFYGDGPKLRINNYQETGTFTDGLSTPFYECDQTAISTLSVITSCDDLPEANPNSNYAVHQSSLVDPTPGHAKISSNSNTTSITLNECSAVNITLDVASSISGGSVGAAYDITVVAENTTTGNQITYINPSSNSAIISGLPGSGYSFETTVAAKTGYIFISGPSFSAGTPDGNKTTQIGSFAANDSSEFLGISGEVFSTTLQYRLLVTTQGGGDPNFTDPLCVADGPWQDRIQACRCGVKTTPLEPVYFSPLESDQFAPFPIVGAKLYADQALTIPFTGLGTSRDSDPGGVGNTTKRGFVKYYTWSTVTSCNFQSPCTTSTYEFQYNYFDGALVDVEYVGIDAGQNVEGCCVNRYIGGKGCTPY